jgi:hypothetical protein
MRVFSSSENDACNRIDLSQVPYACLNYRSIRIIFVMADELGLHKADAAILLGCRNVHRERQRFRLDRDAHTIAELELNRVGRIPDSLNINPRNGVIDAVLFTCLDVARTSSEALNFCIEEHWDCDKIIESVTLFKGSVYYAPNLTFRHISNLAHQPLLPLVAVQIQDRAIEEKLREKSVCWYSFLIF